MDLTLKRINYSPKGVFSLILNPDGWMLFCAGEHAYMNNQPKIPNGTYTCKNGLHQLDHGGQITAFEVMGVPNHSGILLHIGNFPQVDSDGCVLLGNGIMAGNQPMVTGSTQAFQQFMQMQNGLDSFKVSVI